MMETISILLPSIRYAHDSIRSAANLSRPTVAENHGVSCGNVDDAITSLLAEAITDELANLIENWVTP